MENTLALNPRFLSESVSPVQVALWAVRGLFCLNGFLYATWATRIPAIQAHFQMSHATLGAALMLMALGALIAMPSAGWLCSRFGSRPVAAVSLFVYLLGLPLIALMPSMSTMLMALFIFGIGHGTLDVSMNVQAVEVERRWHKPVNSSIHALWSVGGLAGAVVGSLISLGGLDVHWHFTMVTALLSLATLPIITRLLVDDDPSDAASKNSAGDNASVTAHNHSGEDSLAGKATASRYQRFSVVLLGVIAFCIMAGEGAMADWSAVLLNKVLGVNEGIAALGYATFAIMMACGRFAGDGLSSRLGPTKQVRVSGVIATLGVLLVVTSTHVATALAGFALIGGGFATIVPAVFSACGRLEGIPAGVALASVSTIGYFGFLLGPPMIGFIAEWLSLRIALGCLSATTFAVVLLASALKVGISPDEITGSPNAAALNG
ncbi:Fucose permease [Neorhodopirellula lusitana]|uniref:Fucose permease n=1 Tax=Neorhodopirellula lusitana TaxID=445327 RepID=A0ABY1Q785_9BACT|nr:MFS transporter [Neorhodopirellula lusitana]SMP59537.1 Fucose permease [Neorhodopirellula lusitana]